MNLWTIAPYPSRNLATIVSPDRMLMTVAASERRSYLSFVAVLRSATITCKRKLPLPGSARHIIVRAWV